MKTYFRKNIGGEECVTLLTHQNDFKAMHTKEIYILIIPSLLFNIGEGIKIFFPFKLILNFEVIRGICFNLTWLMKI